MSDDIKQSLAKISIEAEAIDGEFDDHISEEEIALIQDLTPDQQKFAQLKVMSSMTDAEIATSLNLSQYRINKWKKETKVILYIKKLQVDQHKATRTATVQQMTTVKDRIFTEIIKRFDSFDPDAYPADTPDWLLRKYAERTAEMTSFRDIVKAYEVIDKQMDNKDLIQTTRDDFVEKVIQLHQDRKVHRRKMELAMEKMGYNSYLDMVESADGVFQAADENKEGDPEPVNPESAEGLSIFGEKDE